MGLQIGNSKVKEVKIGEIGTSTDYTFTNQPDFTLESKGIYSGDEVDLIDQFELNSRIKGTLTFSVSETYTVRIQKSDGTYRTTSVTGTTIDFDAYCVNGNLSAVSIYWQASNGTIAIACDIFLTNNQRLLRMGLNSNFDYIREVTLNLTNFQYGTLSTAPTVSYHNIKEIYVGSNKVFPVKQTGWVTAWEGSIVKDTSYLKNTSNILLENFNDYFIASDKIRFIGTVTLKNSKTWAPMGSSNVTNANGNFFYKDNDKVPLYNNSNIMNLDTYEFSLIGDYLYFKTSLNAYNSGMKGSITYSYSNLTVRFDYYKSEALDFTFNITRIEKYIPE